MSLTCNLVILVGYVGKDGELKYTKNKQIPILSFDLATAAYVSGSNRTTWHRIVAWGQLAESVSPYIKKGALIFVKGSLEKNKYKVNGVPKVYAHVKAKKITTMGGRDVKGSEPAEDYPEDWDDITEEVDL